MQEITKDTIFNMSDEEFEQAMASGDYKKIIPEAKDDDDDTEPTDIDNSDNLDDNFTNTNPNEPESTKVDSNSSSDNSNEPALDNSDDTEPTNQEVEKFSIKANGQRFDFTKDELIKLAPKALNYTKKMQAIAPYRRSISAMQENGITEDDINQLIEMKRGDRTAISNFLNKHNISTLDIDESQSYDYTPHKYGREQNELTETLDDLQHHPQVNTLIRYIDSLDATSRKNLQENPNVLRILMDDIERGYFDRIAPEANKRAFIDENKKPAIDYYIEVANELLKQQQKQVENEARLKNEAKRQDIRDKTRMTGNRRNIESPKKAIKSIEDISDDDLEAFEKQLGILY